MLWSLPRQTSSDQRMISLNSEWTWNVRQNTRQITVPESLLLAYKQRVGLDGVIVWIYLQLLSHTLQQGEAVDVLSWLQDQLEWDSFRVQQGFCLLVENNLVSVEGQTCTLLYPQEAPGDGMEQVPPDFPSEAAVLEGLPEGRLPQTNSGDLRREALEADVAAVVDVYEKRLGTLSPMQRAKLRFWLEAKGVAADVIAYAVDYVTKRNSLASLHTIEQQLRQWYVQGVRDFRGLLEILRTEEL